MPTKQSESPPISVLMYHQIGKFPEPKSHRARYCDRNSFRRQMAFLKFAGYRVISLKDAYAALFGNSPLPQRSVVLTFDDGYENFAEYAFPILRDYGYPAAVFAVSNYLGGHDPGSLSRTL